MDPATVSRNLKEAQPSFDVTLNGFCQGGQNYEYNVTVFFGVFDSDVCQVEYNESINIVPGDTLTVELDTERIPEKQGQEYCANVIVNGIAGPVTST